MKTNVIIKDDSYVSHDVLIDQIKIGDFFLFQNDLHMKTDNIYHNDRLYSNAVSINTGLAKIFIGCHKLIHLKEVNITYKQ